MMRIGIDARLNYYRVGGISTYTQNLITALGELAPTHEFLIFQHRRQAGRLSERFATRKLWTPAHHRLESLALSAELWPHRLNVYHSPDFIPPHRGARRHIITVHDLTFIHYPEYLTADSRAYYNDQIAMACAHADAILAVSQATRQDLIDILNVPSEKIILQYHGIDASFRPLAVEHRSASRERLALPARYLLHVGTVEPRKNISNLVKAYYHLNDQIPDLPPMVLVGQPGWLHEQIVEEMSPLMMQGKLLWRRDISTLDLPIVYSLAEMLFLVSYYEGFGMPALESMACGTVPIVSNRSSLPEVVGDAGLLVDPEDAISIAQAAEALLADETLRLKLRNAGLARSKSFTWERSARIALQAYEALAI